MAEVIEKLSGWGLASYNCHRLDIVQIEKWSEEAVVFRNDCQSIGLLTHAGEILIESAAYVNLRRTGHLVLRGQPAKSIKIAPLGEELANPQGLGDFHPLDIVKVVHDHPDGKYLSEILILNERCFQGVKWYDCCMPLNNRCVEPKYDVFPRQMDRMFTFDESTQVEYIGTLKLKDNLEKPNEWNNYVGHRTAV